MSDLPQPELLQQDQATHILRAVFGYDRFRPPQDEVVAHLIAGGDSLVLMPTGGGKSLCFQIPALVRDGTGVVVSPLIALMQDQVAHSRQAGVRAAFLNSSPRRRTRRAQGGAAVPRGELDLLYVRARAPAAGPHAGPSRAARPSPCSPSTRPTACPSGATTSAPSTCSSRSLQERFPGVPRIALTATADERTRGEILERLAPEDAPASS